MKLPNVILNYTTWLKTDIELQDSPQNINPSDYWGCPSFPYAIPVKEHHFNCTVNLPSLQT